MHLASCPRLRGSGPTTLPESMVGPQTSLEELVALLDRQYRFLMDQEGVDFVRQLVRFLDVVQRDPRLDLICGDLASEGEQLLIDYSSSESKLVRRLASLRDELLELAPDAAANAYALGASAVADNLSGGLSLFDEIVENRSSDLGHLIVNTIGGYPTTSGQLISVLDNGLNALQYGIDAPPGVVGRRAENRRPELDDVRARLRQIGDEQGHARQSFSLRIHTDPGIAFLRLGGFVRELIPRPPPDFASAGEADNYRASRTLKRIASGFAFIETALLRPLDQLDRAELGVVEQRVHELRPLVTRVYEELRLRVGLRRSQAAVVTRFKERCEWHDRDRLQAIEDEDELTAELARYLFDSGLSPLTRPRTAGLEPDLLHVGSHLYVEAKTYARSDRARLFKRGVRQVASTVERLRSANIEIWDVLYVVFRRDGPLYDLPAEVPYANWTLRPLLIDVAPAESAGSQQKHAVISIPLDELSAEIAARPDESR